MIDRLLIILACTILVSCVYFSLRDELEFINLERECKELRLELEECNELRRVLQRR